MRHDLQHYEALLDPDTVVDYGRNWGDSADGVKGHLRPNEKIVDSHWEIMCDTEKVPKMIFMPGIMSGISPDGKQTAIMITSGTSGIKYKLINVIRTSEVGFADRIYKKTGIVSCCEK